MSNKEDVPHVFVVHLPGEEYEIEHPTTCARIERWEGVWDYNCMTNACAEGIEFASSEDQTKEGWMHLPVGRYALQAWVEHTPSGWWNNGEEWDLCIHIGKPIDDE